MSSYYTVILAAELENNIFLLGERPDGGDITEFSTIELSDLPDLQRTDSFFVVHITEHEDDFVLQYLATYKVFNEDEVDLLDLIEQGKLDPVDCANEILESFLAVQNQN